MKFTSLEDALMIAATSHDNILRASAQQHLENLREQNGKTFLEEILSLLLSPQQNVHTVAYSYILNGWILKAGRLGYDIPIQLERIYSHLRSSQLNGYPLESAAFAFRVENLVKLSVAYLAKPQNLVFSQNYIRRLAITYAKDEGGELIFLHQEVLAGISSELDAVIRMRIGLKTAGILGKVIEELCSREDREKFKLGLELSYYMGVLSPLILEKMQIFITQFSLSDELTWKVIARLRSAFIDYRLNATFQQSMEIYCRGKILAERIGKFKSRKESQEEQIWIRQMQEVLGLLYGSLACAFRCNLGEHQQNILTVEVLNMQQYDYLVTWLIVICAMQQNYQDETSSPLKKYALDIIELVSDRMSQADLVIYYQRVRKNINAANQEQILSLLFGANKQIMDLFDCAGIVDKVINYCAQIPQKSSSIYYLFIGKYLRENKYVIQSKLFVDISEFVLRRISLHQEELSSCTNLKQRQHHIIQISHLLTIGMQLVNYPWTEIYRDYMPYLIKKILNYFTNPFLELPEIAQQNLFDSVLEVAALGNSDINSLIFTQASQIYLECFVIGAEGNHLNQPKMCKVQQEFLIIIKQSVSKVELGCPQKRDFLINAIINNPPQSDEVILKETIELLLKVLTTMNGCLAGLPCEDFRKNIENSFRISFQKIAEQVGLSLKLQEPLSELLRYLQDNFDQMFLLRASDLEKDFLTAILLLLELSPYPAYHQFLDCMVIKILCSYDSYAPILQSIASKSRSRPLNVREAVVKLQKMLKLIQCLLESLYINPIWRSSELVTEEKIMIANHPLFLHCKNNVDTLHATLVTDMIKNISLNESRKEPEKWSRRFQPLLKRSAVVAIVDEWFNNFSNS